MNLKDIKQLVEIIDQSSLTDFEWSNETEQIVIRKQKELVTAAVNPVVTSAPIAIAAPTTNNTSAPSVASAPTESFIEIKSPMVGTYYSAPSPNDPVYVKVGDRIEVGQVVCIVEAMKLMNEIKSDVSGTVAAILIENGSPVEFGKVLIHLRK